MCSAGIAGDMGGRVFTIDGDLPEHELTGRAVGLTFEELRRIPAVIAVAFGASKARPILGALRTGVINVLCTDDVAARGVLEDSPAPKLLEDLTSRKATG
jgi:DNA-binding transcriptional regulator LsrR (DeoR family)